MKTNKVKTKGIPLSMEGDFKSVKTIGGGTRLVLKNPTKHNECYTDFVNDGNGIMVYKLNNKNNN
jgi:hypothetical protein